MRERKDTHVSQECHLCNSGSSSRLLVSPHEIAWCTCRLEAYKANGRRLNGVGVKECKNGPHEWRGVVRNNLQATLAAALPEGSIRTSSGVTGVSNFEEGAISRRIAGSPSVPLSTRIKLMCWVF